MTVTRDDLLRAHPSAMSQAYTDFPHYLQQGSNNDVLFDGGDERGFHTLPREFQVIYESQVPLLQISNDDIDSPSFQDFVILAEFSEVEGPVPLCTIPERVVLPKEMCLNRFTVHLMSVDYQVNDVGTFKITEDTLVLRKNVWQGVSVFMQYFTLNDLKARGFVRPFCFGYVTNDHVKLDKGLDLLIQEFGKVTKLLRHTNRKWFIRELEQYLENLRHAQEETDSGGAEGFPVETNRTDPDIVSQEQLVQQYSEIERILHTVQLYDKDKRHENEEYEEMEAVLTTSLSTKDKLSDLVESLRQKGVQFSNDTVFELATEPWNIPLTHPLKRKGEALRPLTILGQLGTIYLLWKLTDLYTNFHKDVIFSEMESLTENFRKHCQHLTIETKKKPTSGGSQSSRIEETEADQGKNAPSLDTFYTFCEDPAVTRIIEGLHTSHNVSASPSNTSSSSYHTSSEKNSLNTLADAEHDETFVSVRSTFVEYGDGLSIDEQTKPLDDTTESEAVLDEGNVQLNHSKSSESSGLSFEKCSQEMEDQPDDGGGSDTNKNSIEETVQRKSWWEYGEEKLVRGKPGNGILKIFKHFPKVAHHILYSILIGRTIVICGNEDQKSKVSRILTAFAPFVPTNKLTHPSWKILRWHQGILIESHISQYKIIGLCIPERLDVHDLISSRDQNSVTILNISQKKSVLLGPAYSGKFLSAFEANTQIQVHFHKSDLSFLTYLGGILTEIQTKVYMLKSLEENESNKSVKRSAQVFKGLGLTSSDIDIVRYLSTLIQGPEHVVELF